MKKKKILSLTVRLLKSGMTYKSALKEDEQRREYKLSSALPFGGRIFIPVSQPHPAPWAELIQSCAADNLSPLKCQSASALLIVECNRRLFAFSFGQGRHVLVDDSFETDFGLKVTLNSVNADEMRSIDAKTIDERTLNIRRQSSRSSTVESFGLDVARDLVLAATGIPRDPQFAKRVTGADALSFSAELEVRDLGSKCQQLLDEYGKTTYRDRFSWIDKLKAVKDTATIQALDSHLMSDIQKRQKENIYLALPGITDWERTKGFYCFANHRSRTADRRNDLFIEDYWSYYDNPLEITVDVLKKRDKAIALMGDDEIPDEYPLYRCIVYETRYNRSSYVLSEGSWFRIDRDFVKETDEAVLQIPESKLNLPHAGPNEREPDYNTRVSNEQSGYLLLDRRNITVVGRGKIEFCDFMTKDRQLVHVKARKSSSSTLSHLFAQGRVSAIALLESQDFPHESEGGDCAAQQGHGTARTEEPSKSLEVSDCICDNYRDKREAMAIEVAVL